MELPRPRPRARPGHYDRSQSRRERREQQRRRIVEAAAEVFANKGYANSNVEDVLRQAGISRVTFYAHFKNIEDLLLAVHEHASRQSHRAIEGRIERVGDPVARLEAAIRAYLEMLRDHADLARVVNREILAAGPQHLKLRDENTARSAALLNQGVAEAYGAGLITRPPDEMTAYALACAIEGLGMRFIDRGEADRIFDAVPKLVELVVRAFR